MHKLRTNFGPCIVEGCDRTQVKRNFCGSHYRRFQRHGDPLGSTPRAKSRPERFWSKVDKNGPIPANRPDLGPCWLWRAYRDRNGYGRVSWNGRQHPAHRVAWFLRHGVWPSPSKQLDHLCRTRGCVCPTHLEEVTQAENIRRGEVGAWIRAKTHCPQGHPYDEENTRWTKKGRACRACGREVSRRCEERRRSTRAPS